MPGIRLLAVVLSGIFVSGCDVDVQTDAQQGVDRVAEAEKIKALEREWSDLFGARNLDGITALLSRETVLLSPGSTPVTGVNAVRSATEQMMADDSVEVSWSSTKAFVAPSGDMAFDYGVAKTVNPDGSVAEGSYLVVWVKEDGVWKIAADMFN